MKGTRLFLSLTGLVLLAACAGGESRLQRETPAPLAELAKSTPVRSLWSVSIGAGAGPENFVLAPASEGDTVVATDSRGLVMSINARNGEERWRVSLDLPVTAGPGVGDGLVVLGTRKGQVVALDAASGLRRWTANVSSEVLAAPAVHSGYVIVQSVDGRITGFASSDGKPQWIYTRAEPALSVYGTGRPVVLGQFVLSGFASGQAVALGLRDGRLMWEFPVTEPRGRNEIERLVDVDAPVLVVRNLLYAAAYQGKVVAIDMRNGRPVWARDLSVHTGMVSDERYLYVTTDRGEIIALDLATGASVWRQDKLMHRQVTGPSVVGPEVAVADAEGYIHWLSVDDGRLVARHRLGSSSIRANPITVTDTLVVLNQGGELSALRLTR